MGLWYCIMTWILLQMVAVLLTLSNEDATAGVQMYFNCPGGEVRAGLAVYDTMNNCNFDVTTLNLGIAASISGFLCGAGKCSESDSCLFRFSFEISIRDL